MDFIVATYLPSPTITRICNGAVETNIDATWIGDQDAFAEYQKLYHSAPPVAILGASEEKAKRYEAASKMSGALEQVVREGRFPSVGDFVISACSSEGGFRYLGNAMAFPVTQTIPSGVITPIRFGTAQEGGYAYSVLWPLLPNIGVLGVHFFQGNIGALYHPLEDDAAIIYSGVTHEQFKQAIENDFGILIDGIKIS